MRIGELDQRIKIIVPTKSDDGFNSNVKTGDGTELDEVWANKRDVTGRELIRGGQDLASLTSVFTIRWRGDVKTTMLIRHPASGLDYAIKSMAGSGRRERQWLQITATAQVS